MTALPDPGSAVTIAGSTALCLDFDGTLAPIVPDPEAAVPLPEVPALLAAADLVVDGREGLRDLLASWADPARPPAGVRRAGQPARAAPSGRPAGG